MVWMIESLHWGLDRAFREDSCKVKELALVANMSSLKKLAAALLKRMTFTRELSPQAQSDHYPHPHLRGGGFKFCLCIRGRSVHTPSSGRNSRLRRGLAYGGRYSSMLAPERVHYALRFPDGTVVLASVARRHWIRATVAPQ